jgi:hypothetical protein
MWCNVQSNEKRSIQQIDQLSQTNIVGPVFARLKDSTYGQKK